MIYTYFCSCEFLVDPQLFDRALGSVSYHRQYKVSRIKGQKDKIASLGAGLLLSYALQKHHGINEREQIFELGEAGKPFMPEQKSVYFNISHSGSMVAASVGDSPCGVDIEKFRTLTYDPAQRYFTEDEKNICVAPEDTISVFTIKEAVIKAAGRKLSENIGSFSAIPGKGRTEFMDETYFFRQQCTDKYIVSVSSTCAQIAQPCEADLQNLFTTEEWI